MTAPLQENSVLSGLSVVVAPERCDEGRKLIREWAMEVNALALAGKHDDCLDLMFSRKRKYDKHRKECTACTEYDTARYSYRRIRVEERK